MKSGVSRAETNKAIRQEALREQLSNGKHVEHVVDMANKIADLDSALESADIHRLKTASELKLKLISKYLPDVKQIEQQINVAADITLRPKVKFID